MKRAKVLTIVGGSLLLIGLLGTFLSEPYTAQIQGRRRIGVIVFGPTEGSPEWKRTEALLAWADRSFYAGLALTALGIILQTWASLSLLPRSKTVEDQIGSSRNEGVGPAPSLETTRQSIEAGEGQNTPLRQEIEALLKAAGVGPEGRERGLQELNVFTQWELNRRLRELTIEVLKLTAAQEQGGIEQAKWAKALVFWTKVLVFVTAVYVLFTGGLVWLAWQGQ